RQTKTAGKGPTAAKITFVRVVDRDVTNATAKLDRVRTSLLRSEVVQLPRLAHAARLANLRAARTERAAHIQRGYRVVAGLFVATMCKLKARLVDRRWIENRRFSHLKILVH